jgi:hypothetical protein
LFMIYIVAKFVANFTFQSTYICLKKLFVFHKWFWKAYSFEYQLLSY